MSLQVYHNCTSKQLVFNKHLECRYGLKKIENFNQYTQYQQLKDEYNWFEWPYKQGKIIKDNTGWDFRMWPYDKVTVLTRSP